MRNLKKFIIESLNKWPDSISLENSRIIKETGGYYSPLLSQIWSNLEDNSIDSFEIIVHWTIFGFYHKEMKKLKLSNSKENAKKSNFSLDDIIEGFLIDFLESEDKSLIGRLNEFEEIADGLLILPYNNRQ
jgi:hypothetical protein